MPPIQLTQVARDEITPQMRQLARELSLPEGASSLPELARNIGLEPEDVEQMFRSPYFRGFLIQELDARSAITVSLLWRMIAKTALDAASPQLRLDCAKLYLARFDPGLRAGVVDAAKGLEQFAERVAAKAVESMSPKPTAVKVTR